MSMKSLTVMYVSDTTFEEKLDNLNDTIIPETTLDRDLVESFSTNDFISRKNDHEDSDNSQGKQILIRKIC